MANPKKGVLEKRDSSRVQITSIVMTRPFSLNRGDVYRTYLGNRESAEVAESSLRQSLCENRARLPPSYGNRESVGYAENQFEQTASLPHFHANPSSIDLAEELNQEGRPPVQCRELSTAEQTQPMNQMGSPVPCLNQ